MKKIKKIDYDPYEEIMTKIIVERIVIKQYCMDHDHLNKGVITINQFIAILDKLMHISKI